MAICPQQPFSNSGVFTYRIVRWMLHIRAKIHVFYQFTIPALVMQSFIESSVPATLKIDSVGQPVSQTDRIQTIDIVRGVALLGILMMNIPGFALPEGQEYYQSFVHPGDANNTTSFWVQVLFEGKMRALFSMLYAYGFCGLLLYPLCNLPARRLALDVLLRFSFLTFKAQWRFLETKHKREAY